MATKELIWEGVMHFVSHSGKPSQKNAQTIKRLHADKKNLRFAILAVKLSADRQHVLCIDWHFAPGVPHSQSILFDKLVKTCMRPRPHEGVHSVSDL